MVLVEARCHLFFAESKSRTSMRTSVSSQNSEKPEKEKIHPSAVRNAPPH
jgi:hypothetical protein